MARKSQKRPSHVLLAIDEPSLRDLLAHALDDAGYPVNIGESSGAKWQAVDLVVVDRGEIGTGSPGETALIDAGCMLPILALVRRGDARPLAGVPGQVRLLETPFRAEVLVGAVGDLAGTRSSAIAIGPCRLFAAAKVLIGEQGIKIRLTEKEAQILTRLAHALGQVVPRDILLNEVWGYGAAVATHTIETHIYRLRRKLAQAIAGGETLILAEAGGYRLVVA